jgi:phage baseplate assembly protein W
MARLSFKDVGIQNTVENTITSTIAPKPIGIKTPLELDEDQSINIFKMHYAITDQMADNLRNLILTNHGERLAMYDFGANLRPLLTDFSNKDNFDQEAMKRIKGAAAKYMPFVNLLGYESKVDRRENVYTGIINILVAFQVASFPEQLIEVTLFIT